MNMDERLQEAREEVQAVIGDVLWKPTKYPVEYTVRAAACDNTWYALDAAWNAARTAQDKQKEIEMQCKIISEFL